MGAPAIPPMFKKAGSDTLTPVNNAINKVKVGSYNTTEGTEVTVLLHQIENDLGVLVDAYKKTVEFTDETDGTEDVVVREYALVAGVLGLWRSSKTYSSAPSGYEAPVFGCQVIADRSNWDPSSKGSGGPYFVWWDGDSWETLDSQGT